MRGRCATPATGCRSRTAVMRGWWDGGFHLHHRPPVRWVRVGRTVAAVPLNPRDVKGQLPLNRGIRVCAGKGQAGDTVTLVKFDGSHPVELMKEAPRGVSQHGRAQAGKGGGAAHDGALAEKRRRRQAGRGAGGHSADLQPAAGLYGDAAGDAGRPPGCGGHAGGPVRTRLCRTWGRSDGGIWGFERRIPWRAVADSMAAASAGAAADSRMGAPRPRQQRIDQRVVGAVQRERFEREATSRR